MPFDDALCPTSKKASATPAVPAVNVCVGWYLISCNTAWLSCVLGSGSSEFESRPRRRF